MDRSVWDSHSFRMEETSERGKERISAEDYSESDNGGNSLKHWGDKEPKSSMSYTDVSVDSAYTSSNMLSSAVRSCPARSVTDSGKEYSLNSHLSETSCDEELSDLEETVICPEVTHIMPEELEPLDEHLAQREMDFKHTDLTEKEEQKEDRRQEKIIHEELKPLDEYLAQREMDFKHTDLTEEEEQKEDQRQEKIVHEELEPFDEYLAQREMDFQHTDLTKEQEQKEHHTHEEISRLRVSSIKDQRLYFQRNYTIFKEHLEPSSKLMDEIISFECRDRFFPEKIREATTRERKADILIKYAARYLDKDSFESLLKKTDHANVIKKLKKGSAQEAFTPIADLAKTEQTELKAPK